MSSNRDTVNDLYKLLFYPEQVYGDGVLIGNWVEDKFKYVLKPFSRCTSYNMHYQPPGEITYEPVANWKNKFKGEGFGPRLFDHQGSKYHDNMSTTYDISYRIIPQGPTACEPRKYNVIFKQYRPQQDYAENYGNSTHYGIKENLEYKWCKLKQDYEKLPTSHYKQMFVAPEKQFMTFKRYAVPRESSSNLYKINRQNANAKLRNRFVAVNPDEPVKCPHRHPRAAF